MAFGVTCSEVPCNPGDEQLTVEVVWIGYPHIDTLEIHTPKTSFLRIFLGKFLTFAEPLESISCRSSLFQDVILIMKVIFTKLKGLSQKVTVHYFGQCIRKLCGGVYPSDINAFVEKLTDCSGLELDSVFSAVWW